MGQKDVETLSKMVVPKLEEAEAKRASSKFLTEALSQLQVKLSLPEAEALQKVVKDLVNKRKKVDAEKALKKRAEQDEAEKKKMEEMLGKNEVTDEDFFKDFM